MHSFPHPGMSACIDSVAPQRGATHNTIESKLFQQAEHLEEKTLQSILEVCKPADRGKRRYASIQEVCLASCGQLHICGVKGCY